MLLSFLCRRFLRFFGGCFFCGRHILVFNAHHHAVVGAAERGGNVFVCFPIVIPAAAVQQITELIFLAGRQFKFY